MTKNYSFLKKLSSDMLSTTGIFFAKSEPMFTKKIINDCTYVINYSTFTDKRWYFYMLINSTLDNSV